MAVQEKDTAHVERLAHEAKRDMKLKYRTVAREVLSRLPRRDRASHSGVEDLRGPGRGRIPKTVVPHVVVNYVAQYYVVVLDVRKLPQSGTGGREREPQTEKQLSEKMLHCANLTGVELMQCS